MNADEIIREYALDKSTWTNKGFHGVPHFFYAVTDMPLKPMQKVYGDSHHITVCFFHDDYGNWFWNDDDMLHFRKHVLESKAKDDKFLQKLLKKWKNLIKSFEEKMLQVDGTDLTRLDDHTLLTLRQEVYDAYVDEYSISISLQDPFSMHAQNFMEPAFKAFLSEKGLDKEFSEIYTTLTAPVTPSFIDDERKSLLKILEKAQAKCENIDENLLTEDEAVLHMLKEHSKKFFWTQNNYAKVLVLNEKHFLNELIELHNAGVKASDALKENEERLRQNKEKKRVLLAKLNLPKNLKDMIDITEVFAYMQDERKKYVLLASHYQLLFNKEIARRISCEDKLLLYAIPPELEKILADKHVDEKKMLERKKHSVIINTLDGHAFFQGPVVDEIFAKVFAPKTAQEKQVKGSCASPGVAIGPAKIIRKTHDLVNMRQGDVLVASMTRPEMVTAMKKACAIVTDEGGITSHAAIVSRELGIPCIVGTKTATKTFVDGDVVEVDAGKGTAKKTG